MTAEDLWAPFAQKYKIHEESLEYVRLMLAGGVKTYSELGVENVRKLAESRSLLLTGQIDFDGEDVEIIVPSPYTSEGIPISVYKPSSRPDVPAIWVYFHGGGFVICNRKTHETTAKILARDSGAIVINVEYRLLPDADAPYAPFEDAEVVTKWVLENKEIVGGKLNSKVGVGGDSAGGQIAIGVTNEIPNIDFQILIYPLADTTLSNESVQEFKKVPGLNEDALKFFYENSLLHMPDYQTNPRVNGMVRTNTASSPPALIILAELDPLVGCGIEYTEKLRAAGVKVQLEIIKEVPHSFFTLRNVYKTKSPEAYNHIVKYIKQFQ
uniref:Alpha/beta hydrolase fold-3 domain-containing protein n=1 Tax=Arion vulgaris TaxID=1028688 RepID=A0A0B7A468_9EUPU